MEKWRRLSNPFRRKRLTAEIEAELQAHLAMAAEDGVGAGMSEAEARRVALMRFGNPVAIRERTVRADAALAMEEVWRDLRHAARQLRRTPAFTATALITLALGIGGTTAIFTLVQQVMLRSLPVTRPDQLWRIGDSDSCCYSDRYTQGDWNFFSWEAYQFFRADTPAFQDLAAFQVGEGNAELGVRRTGSPAAAETGNGEYVSGNFFRTLGIFAWRGRLFSDADDQQGAPPVAVMSFRTWQEKYGSDPSVVGAAYQINGHPFTLIGIAPPGFFGAKIDVGAMPDFWLPLTAEPIIAAATTRLKDPRVGWLDLIGRVRPGTNAKTLEVQLQGELHQWLATHRADMSPQEKPLWEKQTLRLTPGGAGVSPMRENYKDSLRLLLAGSLCVLLMACANIANLLLARGLKERPQTAVRAALGASRARLVRKALAESLTLSMFGAVGGIAVAYVGARLILYLAFGGADATIPVGAAPSIPVLLFALGISLMTGVVFGIAPAWMSSHAEPIEALRGANRSVGGARGVFGTAGAQKTLVIVQVAVSVVLLSAAAMLGQSLRNLEHQNFGFDPRGRYLVSIDPKLSNYKQEELSPLFQEIEEHLRAITGVRMVSGANHAPMTGAWAHDIRIEGKPEPSLKDEFSSGWTRVTPGFVESFGDKIVMGRSITDEDNANTRPVAVINEAFAKRYFGKENPIGQHFGPAPGKNAGTYEIVGVASDLRYDRSGVREPVSPIYFLPEAQTTHFDQADLESREIWSHYLYNIVIWAPASSPDIEARVRRALAEVDPNLAIYDIQPYAEIIHAGFAEPNMIASLTLLFGAVGLVLAGVGLYGVTAYGVERRTGEIGVRMALGADRSNVVRMVLRAAFWQVGIGVAVGIPAAIGAGWVIASQLFGVEPWNPLMLGLATLLLVLTALVAAAIPAHRAAAVDPMQALRSE
jgi:putative ABC transport system permease protein